MTMDFIWGNKRRYISKHILFQKLQKGGLGAVQIGKVWINVLRSWFTRAVSANSQAPILRVAEAKYEKDYGHKPSHLFRYGIISGNILKKAKSVLGSSFELSRRAWSDALDLKELENQPLLENKRILKDKATAVITRNNLPALDDEAVPTALWLKKEIEKIENKPRKNLTDILTANLKNRLDPRLNTVLSTPPIRAPETKTATLRKFINATASSTLIILKLKTTKAEERILNMARKTLEESDLTLIKFEKNLEAEIKNRNQAKNNHLDNRMLRLRHKLRYDSLLTNAKLYEWKIMESKVCSFCGTHSEDMDHLLSKCEILKPLWEEVEEKKHYFWRVNMSQLDKYVGSRLKGMGKRKAEKLFLKVQ